MMDSYLCPILGDLRTHHGPLSYKKLIETRKFESAHVCNIVSSRLLTHLSATFCGNPDSHWLESMSNRNKCTAENLHTNLAMHDNVYYILHVPNNLYLFAKWCAQHFNKGLAL